MKTLFGQRTWENFIKVGEIDEVDVLPKPVEKLVLEIEKTLALEGELACIKQLAKLKAELVDDSIDSLAIQVIDVYEFIVRHIKKWKIVQRNQITEMYYLQVFHQVISILLRDTNLVPVIGEKASKVTKAARELHGKFLDDCHKLNIYGRKVDLLLSVCDIELGANEWKTSSSEITLIRQQSKNVRVNKCILEELTKNLSENGVNVDDCHLLCMDWNEFNGYMYIIKNVDDITVASLVRQLMIPTHFKEVPWFRETLACLLHYKKHYSNLASKLEDAMLIQDRRLAFHNIVESLSIPSVRTPSPSVYLSPKRGK
ncbi:uncharacterized protein BYT42DRAFT_131390 [Radiomyces spectabilis]|uniref:uncharacterized protein n=1 Tax=Radiomyces spectabilis TaxID=64574 RepID=UPI0022200257|nr:uncharacterized protein BYT42DRAFT_131390 [Radiomyces spectabilis]KAI8367570.1 hypothetical protein BYT42DRAFT_131390 [Radiomyces spectabilis]